MAVGLERSRAPCDHDRRDRLAEIRVWQSDDRGFDHVRQFVDVALDLLRIDVVSAGDDQILGAADQGQVVVRHAGAAEVSDVAGAEPAVTQ